jgi:hypothetical protein
MPELSAKTVGTAIQAVESEIRNILDPVAGDVTELEPDTQEFLLQLSQAATELKARYAELRKATPSLPAYEQLTGNLTGN